MIPTSRDVLRRSRRSVALDLRRGGGVEALLTVVEGADVLIEGYRPGVTERLGVGPDACWTRNPRLVYGRMTGWGQSGPLAASAGHDIGYLALTGALHAMGRAGGPPAVPLNLVGDFGGGAMFLVTGVLAALWESRESGRGQVVDAAIVDGASSLMALFHGMIASGLWVDERGVNLLDTGRPWYDVYETSDRRWMAVGAIEPKFFAELVGILGIEADETDRSDPQRWPVLRERMTAVFAGRSREEWAAVFEGTDACVSPVLSVTEAAQHPHLAHRSGFEEVAGVRQPGPAPRLSRTPGAIQCPPPVIGQHTVDVLTECGVPNVDALLASGAAVQA